nr:putative reverse transcriptase domain-containing protein [Tanacetum cinerariifolium]
MDLHAVSRACHHPNGLVYFSKWSNDMSGYIVGISNPSNKESETEITEGLVFNAELLDRIFKVPITTVKCIPHGCRLAFSQALKTVLCNVVAQPDSIDAWVRLLLFSRCTLQVYRPKNRQERSILDGSALGSFGQGGAAVKVLSSFGVAPYCDDTIKSLEAKHPYKPPPSIHSITFSEPPFVAEIDSVFSCIKSFPKDNEIRPIAAGTMWRRLVSKVTIKGVGKEMSKYLSDFQFRVGVSGGAEAILQSVNRVLSEYYYDGSLAKLTVDFLNAFNLVDRSILLHEVRVKCPSISLWVDFLYGQASRLYMRDTYIWSATGVQQGDPLGPLLFALILHPLLHKIKDNCKLLLHAWYLDDGTVIGDSKEVARVLDIIKVSGLGLGLELNIKKTKIFWPSCNGMKLREGLFCVKLLEGAVSRDTDFISGLAMRRAANVVDLMGLFHSYMTRRWRLSSLHIRFGGLGLYSAKLVSSYAFVASRAQSWMLQDPILRDNGICGMDDDYVSTLACLRDTIPSFDVSGFTNKDIVPLKPNKHWRMLSSSGFTAGQAALKAASGKVTKHEKSCIENQHVFIPFAFDTFGFLAREAVDTQSSSTGYAQQCYDT